MNQQDDITQRVLPAEHHLNELMRLTQPWPNATIPCATVRSHVEQALSKLRAPVAEPRLEWSAKALYDAIKDVLLNHRLSNLVDEDGESFPLVDHLCRQDDQTTESGEFEIALICDAIYNDVLTKSAPVADERFKPPFDNCSFRMCDLPGQCRGEGRCHHPARAPVAGEAKNYPGDNVAERLDKMADGQPPGSQAQSDLYAAATIWRKHIAHRAAPQASAEDVRNAALEKAAALVGGHTWAGASQIVSDLIAEHIRALKTQADKDGGQQRDEDAERWRWATATDENAQMLYTIVQAYGGDQQKINERADFYRAALSAPQAEQGERDA